MQCAFGEISTAGQSRCWRRLLLMARGVFREGHSPFYKYLSLAADDGRNKNRHGQVSTSVFIFPGMHLGFQYEKLFRIRLAVSKLTPTTCCDLIERSILPSTCFRQSRFHLNLKADQPQNGSVLNSDLGSVFDFVSNLFGIIINAI